jgi:hypothetical protein
MAGAIGNIECVCFIERWLAGQLTAFIRTSQTAQREKLPSPSFSFPAAQFRLPPLSSERADEDDKENEIFFGYCR